MNKTLVLLVTCTLEETRMRALQTVVDNLNAMPDLSFKEHMMVFDNASTYPGSVELLKNNFQNVWRCKRNVGFWSAIKASINFGIAHEYDYLYIIESDCLHTQDAFKRLSDCERFLDGHPNIGFIRTEEFSVANRHLYDKRRHFPDSVRHAWVVQDNYITKQPVMFEWSDKDAGIYTCNFLAKVPVFSRMKAMREIFDELSKMESFTEMDYQRLYHDRYPLSAILDGGIWNTKLGFDPTVILNASYMSNGAEAIGYKPTRSANIESVNIFQDIEGV